MDMDEYPLPRLALRPNPGSWLGYDLYLHDDGNVWGGWKRFHVNEVNDADNAGVLTQDGERDLIELGPGEVAPSADG
jgi:hypothetical protein